MLPSGGIDVYKNDPQYEVLSLYKEKCGNCHGGTSQGGHNIATTYDDAKKPVTSRQFEDCWTDGVAMTVPKTIGECTLLLTRAGANLQTMALAGTAKPSGAEDFVSDVKEIEKEFGTSLMPGFRGRLTDAEIEDLVSYLSSLQGAK